MRDYIRQWNQKSLLGGEEFAFGLEEFDYVEVGDRGIWGRGSDFDKATEAGNAIQVWNVKC